MSEKLYKKVGKRYKEVGTEFTGFPADGIWFVKDGSNSLMIHLDDIKENMPIMQLDYLKHKNNLVNYVMDNIKDKYSINDICNWACEYFAKVADGEIPKRKARW